MRTTRLEIVAQIQELLIEQVRSMTIAKDSYGADRDLVKRITQLFAQLQQGQGTSAKVANSGL